MSDVIVEACVSCQTYDPQCEERRAPWLVSIAGRANLNAKLVQAISAKNQGTPTESHRDMDQRCDILQELAAAGSGEARQLLYASLTRLDRSDVIGDSQIVSLDGVDGLIRVARQLGQWLRSDPEIWVDHHLIAQCDEVTGRGGGLAALESAAAVDADIASYLERLRQTREFRDSQPARADPASFSGAEIITHINENPGDQCFWLRRWGIRASSDERETVFEALLGSDVPEHAIRLFRCFGSIGLPRFDQRLLRWLQHPDEQLRHAAVRAMAPIRQVGLRQIALNLIRDGELAHGIALLVNNFETGDFAYCGRHLKPFDDADEIHAIVGALLQLTHAQQSADAVGCLLYVYEYSPCSKCRQDAVRALIGVNAAPVWLLAEAALDADPETRALVGAEV